jgi:hypothetical protein
MLRKVEDETRKREKHGSRNSREKKVKKQIDSTDRFRKLRSLIRPQA